MFADYEVAVFGGKTLPPTGAEEPEPLHGGR